ncbi:MAG: phenylacetate--CoA ligase family protein [Propionibacteriaceae bacterium]|nr:phenylacetate--CoA ligase family protein [Propionibacteriaceae bacterium]
MATLLGTIVNCLRYDRLSPTDREAVRVDRLRSMIRHARTASPVYRARYADLPPDSPLSALPPVTKAKLMADFDDWLTDRTVTSSGLQGYLADPDNIGRKFANRYLVFTTSGSTGTPLVALYDRSANAVLSGLNTARGIPSRDDLAALVRRGGTSVGVFAEGFYLGYASVRARQLAMPWKRDKFRVLSALRPVPELVAELNRAKPALLGGYATILELLAEEQLAGRLELAPSLLMAGGEHLTAAGRELLEAAFGCRAYTSYACTEAGPIASECAHRRLHVNDDWVVVEPVDDDYRPVPPGTTSAKILVTNLFNRSQPFIRYEVTDRVTVHDEPCPCGRLSPWLEVEGRTDDVTTFTDSGGRAVRIAPLPIYAVLKEVPGVARFQALVGRGNTVELRLVCTAAESEAEVASRATARLKAFLATHDVLDPAITVSPREPVRTSGGKLRHVLSVAEAEVSSP